RPRRDPARTVGPARRRAAPRGARRRPGRDRPGADRRRPGRRGPVPGRRHHHGAYPGPARPPGGGHPRARRRHQRRRPVPGRLALTRGRLLRQAAPTHRGSGVDELEWAAMSDVLEFAGVGVRRGTTDLLKGVDWSVEEGERWVVLGPNGAGKTTLLQLAASRMHATAGTVDILGERMGAVDVFELRPRIGLASAALADQLPGRERVLDVVMTASYGMTGRWRESYEDLDVGRARDLLAAFGVA